METMKQLVHSLLSDTSNAVSHLQRINEALLKEYELHLGSYLSVLPLQVEIYYVNFQTRPLFVDTNMHCLSSMNAKIDPEIWSLQSGRFGKLYCHLRGHGGIDVCLSDNETYALSATIKSARINGEDVWSQSRVYARIMQIICEHEDRVGVEDITGWINGLDLQVLSRRAQPETGCVYHMKRRLRRMDKNNSLPLHSFMDVWNKKMPLTNVQRIDIYMAAHPTENALEVMRAHNYRFIPTGVRIKYGILPQARL